MNPGNEKYIYSGEIFTSSDQSLGYWRGETTAPNIEKAKRNLLWRAMKEFHQRVYFGSDVRRVGAKRPVKREPVENKMDKVVQLKIKFF